MEVLEEAPAVVVVVQVDSQPHFEDQVVRVAPLLIPTLHPPVAPAKLGQEPITDMVAVEAVAVAPQVKVKIHRVAVLVALVVFRV
jgi:hypothetical protein